MSREFGKERRVLAGREKKNATENGYFRGSDLKSCRFGGSLRQHSEKVIKSS
jgi:hypothetical protein